MTTRKPAVAGTFYPSNAHQLKSLISGYMSSAKTVQINGALKAIIVPHAGYIYSGLCASHGYKLLQQTENIIAIGPSHHFSFLGASLATDDFWATPLGEVNMRWDENWLDDVLIDVPQAHEQEHSIEVQVPFLQTVLDKFSLTAISVGDVDYADLAASLMKVASKLEDTLFVVSSDLSHYHSYEKAVAIDKKADVITTLDTKAASGIEACGITGILAIMHIAKEQRWACKKIFYNNSGDTSGSRRNVVGYGCYAFYEPKR